MNKHLRRRYDDIERQLYGYSNRILEVIHSCKSLEQLDTCKAWIARIWVKCKCIISHAGDDLKWYSKWDWLSLKMDLDYWCNELIYNNSIREIEKQKQTIQNSNQS